MEKLPKRSGTAKTESTKQSIENPEKFLSENKEMLVQFLAYKQI